MISNKGLPFQALQIVAPLVVIGALLALTPHLNLRENPIVKKIWSLSPNAVDLGAPGAPQVPGATANAATPPTKGLVCFGCHNYERFVREEQDDEDNPTFLHYDHIDNHCHVCHVVDGHVEIDVRKGACEACHEEE